MQIPSSTAADSAPAASFFQPRFEPQAAAVRQRGTVARTIATSSENAPAKPGRDAGALSRSAARRGASAFAIRYAEFTVPGYFASLRSASLMAASNILSRALGGAQAVTLAPASRRKCRHQESAELA